MASTSLSLRRSSRSSGGGLGMVLNTALGAGWLPPGCRFKEGGISPHQPPGRVSISRVGSASAGLCGGAGPATALHLVSIPGLRESILEGMATEVSELSSEPLW